MLVLPEHIRQRISHDIELWYIENKDNPHLNAMEKGDIERLINYVKVVQQGHDYHDFDWEANVRDFKRFYSQYDKRRNKTIEVFPEDFLEWYNKIEAPNV